VYIQYNQFGFAGSRTSLEFEVAQRVVKLKFVFTKSLSPLLFIIVMDAVSEAVKREVLWKILYAGDLIVAQDAAERLQIRLNEFCNVLKNKSQQIHFGKTETMMRSKNENHST